MKRETFPDVDSYIAHQPPDARPLLEELRRTILSAVPAAGETIRWGAPFYKYHGFLAGFAAYKNHIRFGIVGSDLAKGMAERLAAKGYTVLKRGIQIPYDQPLPAAALVEILQAKAKKNEAENAPE